MKVIDAVQLGKVMMI